MEIEINPSALSDSPYALKNSGKFEFDDIQIDQFVNDITLGPPTCYLVSGYRGVGKTSLIKKVEEKIKDLQNPTASRDKMQAKDPRSETDQVLFVYTSFAKIDFRHLIRKLIRELYLQYSQLSEVKTSGGAAIDESFNDEFETLYQRTFNDISHTTINSTTKERTSQVELSFTKLLKQIILNFLPILMLIVWYMTHLLSDFTWLYNYLVPICLIIWALANTVSLQWSMRKNKTIEKAHATRSLFDNEIAGTHFFAILRRLNDMGIKTIFVLDELDKVDNDSINSVISELKPYLIGGYASFIVIGGQTFYYKMNNEDKLNDSLLSTVFSKTFHVPLMSSVVLRRLFRNSIAASGKYEQLGSEDKAKLDAFLDYTILKSRLIPRRFISLLKQNLIWKNNLAYLSDESVPGVAQQCKRIIETIDKYDDSKVSVENSGAVRDHILMSLYIRTHELLHQRSGSISKEAFVNGTIE
jgi:hypothetical protein